MNVFQVQLPVKGNDGRDNYLAILGIMQDIVRITGGLTQTTGIGMWTDSQGRVITDRITQVQTYATSEQIAALGNQVWWWCETLDQDALVTATWTADVQFTAKGVW